MKVNIPELQERCHLDLEKLHQKDGIHTLGWLIPKLGATLKEELKSCYPQYAKMFEGTYIEKVIFSGDSFAEAAYEHCRGMGQRSPA